jgi:hypothetical protein
MQGVAFLFKGDTRGAVRVPNSILRKYTRLPDVEALQEEAQCQ